MEALKSKRGYICDMESDIEEYACQPHYILKDIGEIAALQAVGRRGEESFALFVGLIACHLLLITSSPGFRSFLLAPAEHKG